MKTSAGDLIYTGVIEGFYGKPWTQAERLELFGWMQAWGLNTYLYAPKDDLTHRAYWRGNAGPDVPLAELRETMANCHAKGVRFVYALSPGLDIDYNSPDELRAIEGRFALLNEMGCGSFALLFDDIPDKLDPAVRERFGSLAAAQAHVTNEIFAWLKRRNVEATLWFCPTPYCGRMAAAHLGGEGYLATIGKKLASEIDVFWTGPEIISETISAAGIRDLREMLKRKPIIWDNLHANDYDGRRFFCGPYAGREEALREEVRGIMTNPNNEFPLNFVPLKTMAAYVNGEAGETSRASYLEAMQEWAPQLRTYGSGAGWKPALRGALSAEELTWFFDCFYLPQSEGETAERLFAAARRLVREPVHMWGEDYEFFKQRTGQLLNICARLTELEDRAIFYALSRRIWDLREALDLLQKFVEWRRSNPEATAGFHSDFHLPGTYCGGMVANLQRLLVQKGDGGFKANERV